MSDVELFNAVKVGELARVKDWLRADPRHSVLVRDDIGNNMLHWVCKVNPQILSAPASSLCCSVGLFRVHLPTFLVIRISSVCPSR